MKPKIDTNRNQGMKTIFYRLTGVALIIVSVAGFFFSLFGLVYVWRLRPVVTENLLENVELVRAALDTTTEGLSIADQSLETSITSVSDLQGTVESTARTLQETTPLVDTLTDLTRDDLPATVTSAQTSLASAQESARIIDSVLTALNSLPFVNYNPPIPLHTALQQVSASMDALPETFSTLESSLETTNGNLAAIEGDIGLMAADLEEISASLEDARRVIDQYQTLITDLQDRLDGLEENLPAQINLAVWLLSFLLVWAGVAQIGLFLQGWTLIT